MFGLVPYTTLRAIISLKNIGLRRKIGKLGIYLKEFISFMNRDDLILPKYKFESVFIDVSKGIFRKSNHFIIGVIDRPTDKDLKLLKQNMADLIVNLYKMTINIAIWWVTIK